MSIQPIITGPAVVDFNKSATNSGVHKIGGEETARDFKSTYGDQSADKKNIIVTDKQVGDLNTKASHYKYLPSAPVSQISDSKKVILETQKITSPNNNGEQETDENNSESEIISEAGIIVGTGSYVVINGENSVSGRKILKVSTHAWRERINQIYRVGYRRETGTLVNLTF